MARKDNRSEHGDAYVEGRGVALPDLLAGLAEAVEEWPACPGLRVRLENGPAGAPKAAALLADGFEVVGLERDGDAVHLLLGRGHRAPLPRPRVHPPVTVRVVVVLWALLDGRECVLMQRGRNHLTVPMAEPTLHESVYTTANRLLMTACADRFHVDGIVGTVWTNMVVGRSCQQILVRARPGWQTTASADALIEGELDLEWVAADDLPARSAKWAAVLLAAKDAPAMAETNGPWGKLYLAAPPPDPWADRGFLD